MFRIPVSSLQFLFQLPCAVFVFEVTNHEEVISQSLCDEETKTKVVAYLSKVIGDWGGLIIGNG